MDLIKTASDLDRLEIFKCAWRAFKNNLWLGTGPDTFMLDYRHYQNAHTIKTIGNVGNMWLSAHNDILQIMATLGIFGLLAYVFLIISIYYVIYFSLQIENYSCDHVGIAGAIASFFVQNKVNPVPLCAMVLVALFIGLIDRGMPKAGFDWCARAIALLLCFVSFQTCKAEYYQLKAIQAHNTQNFPEEFNNYNLAANAQQYDWKYTEDQLHVLWYPTIWNHDKRLASIMVGITERQAKLHPNDPAVLEWRAVAWSCVKLFGGHGNDARAIQSLQQASVLAPMWPTIQQRLGALNANHA